MSKNDSMMQHGQKRMNKQLLPHEWLDDAMPMSDSDDGGFHDYNSRENPIDANSFEDIENEKLCQFCIHFADKKNYLGQITHFCAKSSGKVSVNSGTKCFNNKFKRA